MKDIATWQGRRQEFFQGRAPGGPRGGLSSHFSISRGRGAQPRIFVASMVKMKEFRGQGGHPPPPACLCLPTPLPPGGDDDATATRVTSTRQLTPAAGSYSTMCNTYPIGDTRSGLSELPTRTVKQRLGVAAKATAASARGRWWYMDR